MQSLIAQIRTYAIFAPLSGRSVAHCLHWLSLLRDRVVESQCEAEGAPGRPDQRGADMPGGCVAL
ncbi:hypothetical protein JCM15831A_05300 [Asaia astilbis]